MPIDSIFFFVTLCWCIVDISTKPSVYNARRCIESGVCTYSSRTDPGSIKVVDKVMAARPYAHVSACVPLSFWLPKRKGSPRTIRG